MLLVDLENLSFAGTDHLSTEEVEDRLARVIESAGPVEYALAVAPRSSIARHGAALARLGLRWVESPTGPDAADHRIVALAAELAPLGYDEFVIASGDHYFVALAKLGHLTVIAPTGQPVSRELASACAQLIAA